MTTFTTEDRIQFEKPLEPTWEERWGKKWVDGVCKGWNTQTSIEYFWPLTEQIGLDLDYTDCSGPQLSYSCAGIGAATGLTWATVASNVITPQMTIEPKDTNGYLQIGGINLGMEKKPNLFRRTLFKLLGFGWKQK